MTIYLNGQAVTGNTSQLHFINWCLSVERENEAVPRTALEAARIWQEGVYRGNAAALAIVNRAGITIEVKE